VIAESSAESLRRNSGSAYSERSSRIVRVAARRRAARVIGGNSESRLAKRKMGEPGAR